MKYQMFTDEEILREGFRAKIIKEIQGAENVNRKAQQQAMLEMLRDQIIKFVIERLKKQGFKDETLAVMVQRATNINIYKKIVGKKARSYSKGVDRSAGESEEATSDLEIVAEAMGLTQAMKKADQYRKAAKNCLMYIYPDYIEDPTELGKKVLSLCAKVYFPHLYDVIPDANDREKVKCVILSPFAQDSTAAMEPSINGGDGRNISNYANPIWRPDRVEQTIANSPMDSGAQKREYVWWTAKYHLTTDENGKIIPGKSGAAIQGQSGLVGYANPIQRLPFVNLTEEQDGEFWAMGGDDLVQATILLNLKLTDMEAILHQQGWGQLVITGEGLKKKDFAIGPQVALALDTEKGATHQTDAKILSHDPHTEQHMKSAEMHVALALTTNNLSVKSVSTSLDASSYAAAIAKMVDEAENMDDISEDQAYYAGKEKEAMVIGEAWLRELRGTEVLWQPLKETKPLQIAQMNVQYHNQEQVVSEQERLQNMKLRKELGIDSRIDLIKKDNPGMTDKQAMAKALKMMNEEAELAQKAREMGLAPDPKPGEEGEADEEGPQNDRERVDGDDKPGDNGGPGAVRGERTEDDL